MIFHRNRSTAFDSDSIQNRPDISNCYFKSVGGGRLEAIIFIQNSIGHLAIRQLYFRLGFVSIFRTWFVIRGDFVYLNRTRIPKCERGWIQLMDDGKRVIPFGYMCILSVVYGPFRKTSTKCNIRNKLKFSLSYHRKKYHTSKHLVYKTVTFHLFIITYYSIILNTRYRSQPIWSRM